MKNRNSFLLIGILALTLANAQPPKIEVPKYSINNVPLPSEMNNQVCISGMKFYDGKLYFASERCPIIFVADPSTGKIVNSINLQVSQKFEMEGLSSYKDKLYLISEEAVALYEVDLTSGAARTVSTSISLPPKSKEGDGMEGIAGNESNQKFYLLRERNEEMTKSEIYTFSVETGKEGISLKFESKIEMPLENTQWRYSDICYDKENNRLICLKSYSKGKLRQQFLESMNIDANGTLQVETLKNIPVDKFSEISNKYKDQDYSMNLEGITLDNNGNIFIISDNTSGKAKCDLPAKEKTILLELKKI
ncbi:MAG: SdiA-regulated domain-containing protein [Chitinophagaceae bacterium]